MGLQRRWAYVNLRGRGHRKVDSGRRSGWEEGAGNMFLHAELRQGDYFIFECLLASALFIRIVIGICRESVIAQRGQLQEHTAR